MQFARAIARARNFSVHQHIVQIKEMILDYLVVIVAQKPAEICPDEINVKITLLRLVTT